MEVTDSTKTIVGVTFGFLYDQMYDDKRRNDLMEEVSKYTQEMLMDPGIESKVIKYQSWPRDNCFASRQRQRDNGRDPQGPEQKLKKYL